MNAITNGTYITNSFSENICEPDGSTWIRIFHHSNPAEKLFPSSSVFTNALYIDQDRWFNISLCNEFNGWELMLVQSVEKNSPREKYRWAQSVNPMTATYAQVAASNITKNASTEYVSFTTGGLYCCNMAQTFLCTNNGREGNWWGAVGAKSQYQNGVPAWNGKVVKTGFVDLYIRVDNNTKVRIQNNMLTANNFIEN